ncbi:hypothetical protein AWV63_06300 [Micromonospora rifamycinica]|nr:hypothetical protein AWV63_06300 [Micromonospora rifamycinica]
MITGEIGAVESGAGRSGRWEGGAVGEGWGRAGWVWEGEGEGCRRVVDRGVGGGSRMLPA